MVRCSGPESEVLFEGDRSMKFLNTRAAVARLTRVISVLGILGWASAGPLGASPAHTLTHSLTSTSTPTENTSATRIVQELDVAYSPAPGESGNSKTGYLLGTGL